MLRFLRRPHASPFPFSTLFRSGIDLPGQVTCTITDSDPVVKGQTAASSYKPAVLENGSRVLVPPFISAGEKVVVDTNELSYLRRAD